MVYQGCPTCRFCLSIDCLDLFRRPAPAAAITRVEILYEVDLFNKLISRFVSLKINDLGSYKSYYNTSSLAHFPSGPVMLIII